jgi:hypothetical protein
MRLTRDRRRASAVLAATLLVGAVACRGEQRAAVDTTTAKLDTTVSSAGEAVRTALSVMDVDMGRHVAADRTIADKTDDFAPGDTIFASVHSSGTATNGAVTGRWTYADGSVVDEKTDTVTTTGDAHTVFYIMSPTGLKKGKYTLHVVIDGKEVRTKDVTVK